MSLTLYRGSKLGETLSQTINEMKEKNRITETLGDKVLQTFDKVIIF
jgi:hypothetical protein